MYKLKVTILTLAVLLLLIGCGTNETQPAEPTEAPATEAAVAVEPTVAEEMEEEPTAEPTATEEIAPTEEAEPTEAASPTEATEAEPTEEPVEELVMDNCQICHNDQEMLTQTADPVVEDAEPSESSGVG
jgi:outer membrane biosynthesis protein TonB